jgi:hypothetical protein
MKSGFMVALCSVATLALASAAQAADLDDPISPDNYRVHEGTFDYGQEAPFTQRREWRSERYYGGNSLGYCYGWPGPEHPHWNRPVFARRGWSYGNECRVIVKERVNRWGERVIRQMRVCD